ncbi:MAG: Npun_R2821/Npun_R2822 family protein [Cyanobacteria bacterium P01_E01_bin.6]
MQGICTLANDRVYDQVVALLNSIETNAPGTPVCIYPYNDQIERISAEANRRDTVQIYSDQDSITQWDTFVRKAWDSHPTARDTWRKAGSEGYHRVGTHRRFCAFDGPFDQFLYMDADTLLLDSPHKIWECLANTDFVVYDFQFKQPKHVYDLSSSSLKQKLPEGYLATGIFCSGFYASHKGLFSPEKRNDILQALQSGDAEVLYPMAPDQTLLNYMVMRCGLSFDNLSRSLPKSDITGNSVTSTHFEASHHALYDKGVRLLYVHYIGLSSQIFARVDAGDNIDFPYRDIFLHYRYLHEPNTQPNLLGKPTPYNQPANFMTRVLSKLSRLALLN